MLVQQRSFTASATTIDLTLPTTIDINKSFVVGELYAVNATANKYSIQLVNSTFVLSLKSFSFASSFTGRVAVITSD